MRRRKGSVASFSWMRPKVGEARGGKGMQDTKQPGERLLGLSWEDETSEGSSFLGVVGLVDTGGSLDVLDFLGLDGVTDGVMK